MKETIIKRNSTKLVSAIAGSLIFVVACIILVFFEKGTELHYQAIYLFGIFFFGAVLLYAMYKLKDDSPAIIINEQGITDNSSWGSIGFVEWENIEEIYIQEIKYQRILTIGLKDANKVINKLPFTKAIFAKINYNNYGSPMQISSTSLDCNIYELFEMIKDF